MLFEKIEEIYRKFNLGGGGRGSKDVPFSSLFLLRGPGPPPPPLVVPWAIKILGPYFNVAVDAMGPETDFTLKTNRKK